ncbi:MAG: hypothetical protein GIW99_10710 [Candidatus Eremiobacteraeota bacterium]|nr:hypothetical protein [Candidatus Eremiobacteraeota bacterium]MBC5828133.1 hypothetical protein [Candidatus Eremiobacteraeota bacterium]
MSDTSTNAAQITAEWIRRPLPDLGGISPEEAASDPSRRKQLDDIMTELAGHYVRITNLGLPGVNPRDIRKALGLDVAPPVQTPRPPARSVKAGPVKRNALLDELGTALTGGDVDSVAFFNTKNGTIDHYMHNLGDQENERIAQAGANPDLKKISPVTTEVRYGIMSDFIGSVEDINIAGRLRSAISGKGAFRRFREAVDEDDSLRRRWLAYRTKRHYYLALDWIHKLALKPEQYGVATSDYDWQPPTPVQPTAGSAESAAPAGASQEPAAEAAVREPGQASDNGQLADHTQASRDESAPQEDRSEPAPTVRSESPEPADGDGLQHAEGREEAPAAASAHASEESHEKDTDREAVSDGQASDQPASAS